MPRNIKFVRARRGMREALNELSEQDRVLAAELIVVTADQAHAVNEEALGNSGATYTSWTVFALHDSYNIWGISGPGVFSFNSRDAVYLKDVQGEIALAYDNTGLATSIASKSFDTVLVSSGETVTDDSAEAATDLGTAFELYLGSPVGEVSGGSLYVGSDGASLRPFQQIAISVQQPGAGYSLFAEYWDGSIWTSGTTNILENDRTQGFSRRGTIDLNVPVASWNVDTVNGTEGTWIRIRSLTRATRIAKLYSVRPASGVSDLLLRSPDQVLNRQMAWTSFEGKIYVTIPNAGPASLEGDRYVQSGSSDALRRSFYAGFNRHYYLAKAVAGGGLAIPASGNIPVFSSGSAAFYSWWATAEDEPEVAGWADEFIITNTGFPGAVRHCIRSGTSYNFIDLISSEAP